jgi:hypothetical protein
MGVVSQEENLLIEHFSRSRTINELPATSERNILFEYIFTGLKQLII